MTSRVKELKKYFDKGSSPKKIVEKTLPSTSDSYLYGGKTVDAQQRSVPLVVIARPGAYHMVCDGDACYIRVPHSSTAIGQSQTAPPPPPPAYSDHRQSNSKKNSV